MNLKKAVQAHALSMGLLIGWLLTGLSVLAAAQEEPLPPPPPPVGGMVTMQVGPGFAGGFVHEEMADGRVVKGAPMTANVTMTRDTTLGDGNTIHTENQTTIYRDSQGRVRREIGFELNTPTTGAAKGTMIAITDPVSGNRYMLNPQNKTAHQMPFPPPMRARVSEGEASGGEAPSWVSSKANEENVSTEQLGTKTILGLSAVGTRVIRTIAAGQIGNAKPIEVVTERWFSTDLQIPLMTTHKDPMMGTMTSKVTNVSRGEPDASLFQIPSDYKVETGKGGNYFYLHTNP